MSTSIEFNKDQLIFISNFLEAAYQSLSFDHKETNPEKQFKTKTDKGYNVIAISNDGFKQLVTLQSKFEYASTNTKEATAQTESNS